MRHLFLTFNDLRDRDGRVIPFHVQYFSFLIWTAPERGLSMRDYRSIFRRVGKAFGYRIGFWAALKFTRQTPRVNRVTRSWFRSEYHLTDLQMDQRQKGVIELGLRGTGFDKMDRIRARAYEGIEYRNMGPETCDREPLFREILSIDLSGMPVYGDPGIRPRAGGVTSFSISL